MRKLLALVAVAVTAALSAGPALADCNGAFVNDCTGSVTDNSVTNQGGQGGAGGNAAAAAAAGANAGVWNVNGQHQGIDSDIRNTNVNGQHQGQEQGQRQGQGQLQGQGQVNGNALNKQNTNITFEAAPIPDKYTIRNTPGMALGGLYPSAPCMGTSNIGGSGPGFSLGIGTSWTDKNCQIMETSRLAPTDADKISVWCQSEFAANAPSCKKAKQAEAAEAQTMAKQSDKRKASGQREAVSAARPTASTVAKSDPYADYFSR